MSERGRTAGTHTANVSAVGAARFVLIACGVVALAVALAVLAGWHTDTAGLVQLWPDFAQMQYNVALGVLLLGTASVLLGTGRGRIAIAPAAATALLGAVSGSQYLTGIDFGIDRWFMDPLPTTVTSNSAQMAPNTALALVLLGTAIMLAGRRRHGVWQLLVAGTLAASAAGLALIAVFGYATGIESAYGWAHWTEMGAPTAYVTFLLGVGLFALMLAKSLRERTALALRLEIPVGVVLLVMVVVLTRSLDMQDQKEIRGSLESEGQALRNSVMVHVNDLLLAFSRMGERWEQQRGMPLNQWEADASNYIENHPAIYAIARVDSNAVVRSVVPKAGTEAAIGLSLMDEPRRARTAEQARTQDATVISPAIELATGGKGFITLTPVLYQGEFRGYINGVFRFDRLFQNLQQDPALRSQYHYAVYDGSDRVYASGPEPEQALRQWQVEQVLTFGTISWRMQVWPSAERLTALQSPLPEITLAGGMLLVALSMLSLHGFHLTYRRTLEVERANTALEREIDQRRQTERDLATARARLNNILEGAGEGIYGLDTEGRTTFANPAACRMTGWPAEEMIGHAQHEMIHHSRPDGTDYPREECPIYAAFNDGQTHAVEDEEVFWRRDGEPFPVEYVSTPLRDEAGNVAGAVVVFRDVTERRERDEALRRRTAELAAANQELEGFAYSVSHDLRAPLRSMDGFSQVLFEDFGDRLDGDARDHLERIRNASRRMEWLIDGILAISRVSRAELEYEHVDLSALAEETVAGLRDLDPDRQVAVDIEPGLVVEGDPRLLRAVLENLIGNAWKFTAGAKSARIDVGRERIDGVTAYYVRDNGAGFNPRYVHKLFHPFQRLHSDSEFEGTGIGLATVARVIHRHGGSVRADGRPGAGATIHFSFEPIGDDS